VTQFSTTGLLMLVLVSFPKELFFSRFGVFWEFANFVEEDLIVRLRVAFFFDGIVIRTVAIGPDFDG